MSAARLAILTTLTMIAFAGNSLICRAALKHTVIDPASFTAIRLVSGAVTLWLLGRLRRNTKVTPGNWRSAAALFGYAAGFSFAYVSLPTATGALLLFGAVQATMIGYGIWRGECLLKLQIAGLGLALAGLIGLLSPGLSAPPLIGALWMSGAGAAWGIYSLRGKGAIDPTSVTAGNFLRAVPFAVALCLFQFKGLAMDSTGLGYALLSGAVTSGLGYAIWYSVLPALPATLAATVQLSVPVIAALSGVAFLGEPVSLRLVLASVGILGGIALVVLEKQIVKSAAPVESPRSK